MFECLDSIFGSLGLVKGLSLFQKSGYDVYVAKTKWVTSKTHVHINKLIVPATRPQKATLAEELFRVSSNLKALKNELPQYFKCVIRLGLN